MTMTTTGTQQPGALAKPSEDGELARSIQMIMRAASDPSVSVEKVRELYAFAKEMEADRARKAYFAALSRLQAKLPQIQKHGLAVVTSRSGEERRTPFVRYEDIDAAVRPIAAEEGFAFSFDTKSANGKWEILCMMSHKDGHSEKRTIFLDVDDTGSKNKVQAMGSTVTYARRYLLEMHLNLVKVGEDDDGAGGRATVTPDQAEVLRAQVEALGGNIESHQRRIFKWLKVTRYEEILASDFERAKNGIAQMGKERA